MKLTSYSFLAALFASGMAHAAATAYTTPVGYTTETMSAGLNYIGLTLHETPDVQGLLTGVTANSVSDSTKDFDTLLTPGTKYILEINNSGFIQIIDGSDGLNTAITTSDDLSAVGVASGNSYTIRKSATIASIFGADAANLVHGFLGSAGADQVWLFNANTANFDVFYYDDFGNPADETPVPGWLKDNGDGSFTNVTPGSVIMPYDEGIVFNSSAGTSLVISGTIKKSSTVLAVAGGLNYVGGISPAQSNVESAFGASAPGLVHGFLGSAGADQIWLFNAGTSNFDVFYYDDFGNPADETPVPGWLKDNGDGSFTNVTPSAVSISSGYIFNASTSANILQGAPSNYSNL